MRRVKSSKSSKIASSNNIQVCASVEGHSTSADISSAYSIDDGKGGKIHVNVCFPFYLYKLLLTSIIDQGNLYVYHFLLMFSYVEPWSPGLQERI